MLIKKHPHSQMHGLGKWEEGGKLWREEFGNKSWEEVHRDDHASDEGKPDDEKGFHRSGHESTVEAHRADTETRYEFLRGY